MISRIPFKILNIDGDGFHLMVKIRINRKAANVIIDTGASKTVFDKVRIAKYVKSGSINAHDKLSSGLGTNTMESHVTMIRSVMIGDVEIPEYKTVLLDLSHVNNSYQQVGLKPVDGVLGSDILLQYAAVIDYSKKELRLTYKKKKVRK